MLRPLSLPAIDPRAALATPHRAHRQGGPRRHPTAHRKLNASQESQLTSVAHQCLQGSARLVSGLPEGSPRGPRVVSDDSLVGMRQGSRKNNRPFRSIRPEPAAACGQSQGGGRLARAGRCRQETERWAPEPVLGEGRGSQAFWGQLRAYSSCWGGPRAGARGRGLAGRRRSRTSSVWPDAAGRFIRYATRPSGNLERRSRLSGPRAPYAQRRQRLSLSFSCTRVLACREPPEGRAWRRGTSRPRAC